MNVQIPIEITFQTSIKFRPHLDEDIEQSKVVPCVLPDEILDQALFVCTASGVALHLVPVAVGSGALFNVCAKRHYFGAQSWKMLLQRNFFVRLAFVF